MLGAIPLLMISLSITKHQHETVVAACDEELLGRELKENGVRLLVDEGFYGGEIVEAAELAGALRVCTIGNLVGKEAVEAAISAGFVDRECCIFIEGVPHAQIVSM